MRMHSIDSLKTNDLCSNRADKPFTYMPKVVTVDVKVTYLLHRVNDLFIEIGRDGKEELGRLGNDERGLARGATSLVW